MPSPGSEPVPDANPVSAPALAPAPTEAIENAERPPCPAPADFRAEIAAYDRAAHVDTWMGPRYRMTYRTLGQGPPLVVVPGIAATYRVYALLLNRLSAKFRTILYDYPGEHPGDSAHLGRITHENLVDDVFGLIEHLRLGRVFLFAMSFGTTVALRALSREPRRFPKAVLQGAFAHRRFTFAERLALAVGRRMPGTVSHLPLRNSILTYNSRAHFPEILEDRWRIYLEQNGLTPVASLAHRVDLVSRLDLRPILPEIPNEILLLHGNEDRIVTQRDFDAIRADLGNARAVVMPLVGHQPHFTHAEALAGTIVEYLIPCAPGGCPNEQGSGA